MKKLLVILLVLVALCGCSKKEETNKEVEIEKPITLLTDVRDVYLLDGAELALADPLTDEELETLQNRLNVVNFAFYEPASMDVKVESLEHITVACMNGGVETTIILCEPYLKFGDVIYDLGYDQDIFTYVNQMLKDRK